MGELIRFRRRHRVTEITTREEALVEQVRQLSHAVDALAREFTAHREEHRRAARDEIESD